VVEGGREAVTALAAVLPVLEVAARERHPPRRARLEEVDARRGDAPLAFRRRDVAALRTHELAGLPAAREIRRRRRRADRLAVRTPGDVAPIAVLLGVPVSRVHLDERLAIGV